MKIAILNEYGDVVDTYGDVTRANVQYAVLGAQILNWAALSLKKAEKQEEVASKERPVERTYGDFKAFRLQVQARICCIWDRPAESVHDLLMGWTERLEKHFLDGRSANGVADFIGQRHYATVS